MRIAVAGGTGTIGRRIVAALTRDGHEVRALSRSASQYAINLVTGAGLPAAIEGCEVVQAGGVAWTIVRATQVHDLIGGLLSATARWRVLPAAEARFQPVDAQEAAEAVAAASTNGPRMARISVGGPEVHDLRELSRMWHQVTGRGAIEVPVRLPGKLGRAVREGALTCEEPDVRGRRTFADWLVANAT